MKKRTYVIIAAILITGLVAGFSWGEVSLKVTGPIIDLNELIQEAPIGHVGESSGPQNSEINDPEKPIESESGGNTEGLSDVGQDNPDPDAVVSEFVVRINDRNLFINETKCQDIDAVEAAIRANFTEGAIVTLEDDYAEYYSYFLMKNRLEEMGLEYSEVEIE